MLACLSGFTAGVLANNNGACLSGGVNVCGLGKIGGKVCANKGGVTAKGSVTVAGTQVNGQTRQVVPNANNTVVNNVSTLRLGNNSQGILGPVTVDTPTTLTLRSGQVIKIKANTTIVVDSQNVLHQVNAQGVPIANAIKLGPGSNYVTLAVPPGGNTIIDPSAVNPGAYDANSTAKGNNGTSSAVDAYNPCIRQNSC